MMDEIKKVLLFGVGAVASTYEKADEGKELGEELKRTFKEKTKESENNKIEGNNYVLRDEYEVLKAKVYKLEKLLNKEEEK